MSRSDEFASGTGQPADPTFGSLPPDRVAEYKKYYQSGWRHSATSKNPSLENAPDEGTGPRAEAWEDGYLDHATDREKWAFLKHRTGEQRREEY